MNRIAKFSLIALAVAASFGASAATDIKQYATGYFVDVDANKYNDPYYRWHDGDWGWTHGAIGGSPTTATLSISAFDVDAPSEVDNIYALDSGTWTLLGSLGGGSDIWSYTTFTLGSNFYDDIASGLQVKVDIDSTHTYNFWALTLAKSVLVVDGGTLPPPVPGIPEPETYAMLLAGLGLLGLAARRRGRKEVA